MIVHILQVAKRRSGFGLRNSATKLFKHLEFIPLTSIKSIIQFGDTGGEVYAI